MTGTQPARLKVWHIPQVPMEAFEVFVDGVEQGISLMNVLADYDRFQFEHRVKPDYCNANGISYLDTDGEWSDLDVTDDDEIDYVERVLSGEVRS